MRNLEDITKPISLDAWYYPLDTPQGQEGFLWGAASLLILCVFILGYSDNLTLHYEGSL